MVRIIDQVPDNGAAPQDDLIRVAGLRASYPVRAGLLRRPTAWVNAVDDVSFAIRRGETLGLVGESGCGKSTLARTLLGLRTPSGGAVYFEGEPLFGQSRARVKALRKSIQLIFQDPYASLDPRLKVGRAVRAGLAIHGIGTRVQRDAMVAEMFERVGLNPTLMGRYPHELSGGQRQRVGIARALILRPKFIICDEPVSALDVSVQSQILNLLRDLQRDFGLTSLFIAHNLSVVEHIADRVAVMYLGKIVELAPRQALFENPRHPYTKALISAIPRPDPRAIRQRILLQGEVPNPADMPTGCRFHGRCPFAVQRCRSDQPPLVNLGANHWSACWLANQEPAGSSVRGNNL